MTITNPFNVKVVRLTVNNGYDRYYFNNNYEQPSITLFRGQTYTFNLDQTVAGSPFWIKTIASTGTGNSFNTGVTGNGSQSGTITFVVPNSAPDILYYGSQNNNEMWGKIFIFNGIPSPTEATTTIVNPIFKGTGVPLIASTAPLQFQRWNLPLTGSLYTFTGSASAASVQTPVWTRLNTGATAGSTALYRANPNAGLNFGRGFFGAGIQFSRPVWLIYQGQMSFAATDRIRIQFGGIDYQSTTVGPMTPTNAAFSGLGFLIEGGAIKLETINTLNNVATLNTSATLATHNSWRLSLKAYSDGLGNVKVYVNENLVSTLNIGPTQDTGTTVCQLRVSAENTTAANAAFVDLIQDGLSVIVE